MTHIAARTDADALREEVRDYYRAKATEAQAGQACCRPDSSAFGPASYTGVGPGNAPDAAVRASMGCGNPTAVAELREGETVLDLGSGGGLDVILSARRVGSDGLVFGLDFLEEMLALARRNIKDAGIRNIILLKGSIEAIPLPADTVDVVISNCVINMSLDKAAVFGEIARVLAPGGRIGISDVVAENGLGPALRAERRGYSDCISGAVSVSEYKQLLTAAGLAGIRIECTRLAAEGVHSAIIRARKPETQAESTAAATPDDAAAGVRA
jgi:SAM-dependent methyltransferase